MEWSTRQGVGGRFFSALVLGPMRVPGLRWWLRWLGGALAAWGLTLGSGFLARAGGSNELDEWLFRRINGIGYGPDPLFEVLDPHNRNYAIVAFAAFLVALLSRRAFALHVYGLAGLALGLSFFLSDTLVSTYKWPRPEVVLGSENVILNGNTWAVHASFPSGHVTSTTAIVAAAALGLARVGLPRWLAVPFWLYLGAVLFTRVQFGAHFPFDALAGVGLGYASARLALALFDEVGVFGVPVPRVVPRRFRSRRKASKALATDAVPPS